MEPDTTFSPPYNIPWATFLATIEKIAADVPNKIDRSYLDSRSGSEQSYLLAAFKGFGLIADKGEVSDELRDLAAGVEGRPAKIADLLRRFYPQAVKLGESNATPGELDSAFSEAYPRISGASRTKAIRFFLFAADYAQIPKSPLWKVAKATGSGARKGRRGRPPGSLNDTAPLPKQVSPKDMKQAYFDLLVEKAKATEDNTDLLDRIERLLGTPQEPGGAS